MTETPVVPREHGSETVKCPIHDIELPLQENPDRSTSPAPCPECFKVDAPEREDAQQAYEREPGSPAAAPVEVQGEQA